MAWVAVVLCLPGVAFGKVTLRLSGVPEELSFPLPDGVNRVLTVFVAGGRTRSVWLAGDELARARILLDGVGDDRYQINLADPVVAAVLGATDRSGQFRIFAETEDGEVVASIAVRYSFKRAFDVLPKVFVYAAGERHQVFPGPHIPGLPSWEEEQLEMLYELWPIPYLPSSELPRRWFSPEQAETLEVQFKSGFRVPSAEVRARDKSWPLLAKAAANVLVLAMTPEIRKAWGEHGSLTVHSGQGEDARALVTLKAPPQQLDLPEEAATFTVVQRCSKRLPGSREYLRVVIGDITAGQVLLRLRTADGKTVIGQTSVKAGDHLSFLVGANRYTLSVKQLVNLLFGDDYAVLEVSKLLDPEEKKIRNLLTVLEASEVVFIRNEKEYTPAEGAAHIRAKYEHAKEEIETLEEFIDKVASHSWLSGKPYLVKLPDGTTLEAKDWLRKQPVEFSEETGEKE